MIIIVEDNPHKAALILTTVDLKEPVYITSRQNDAINYIKTLFCFFTVYLDNELLQGDGVSVLKHLIYNMKHLIHKVVITTKSPYASELMSVMCKEHGISFEIMK